MWTDIKGLFSKALSSRFLRSAGTISGGAAAAQLIAFAASPILTRLYSPETYGVLALMLGVVTFAVAMASLHYEMAIALPKKNEDAAAIGFLALTLGTAFAGVTLVLFAPQMINLLPRIGLQKLTAYWWLVPATIFASSIHQVLTLWHLRRERYKEVAANGIAQSLTQNGGPIVLGLLGFSGLGLLLGFAVSRMVAAGGLILRAVKLDRGIHFPSWESIRHTGSQFKSFPTIGLAGALLHIACFQLPAFLLADIYGAHVAGFYMLQDRVLGVPLAVLAQGVASVFYVNAARMAEENPIKLKESYLTLLRNLTLSGIIPTVLLLAAGPWLFNTVFGERWEVAGEYARIMAVPTLLRYIAGPLFRCLTILKRQGLILLWDGAGLVLMLALFNSFDPVSDSGLAGVWTVALSISLTYAGLLASSTFVVFKRAKVEAADNLTGTSAEIAKRIGALK